MKTNILTLFLALSFISNAQITTDIDDTIFEQHLINLGYDTGNPNGWVFTDNISDIDTLIISGYPNFEIQDLSGIEYFSSLQYLDCSENNIDSLNLNQNTTLTHLICSNNIIDELIIDNLLGLYILDCSFNLLNDINLLGNASLTTLICFENTLNTLVLSNNQQLGYLDCGVNNITNLDLSTMDLTTLNCQNNALNDINLSGNTSLKWLNCYNNDLQSINLSDNINLENLFIGNVSSQPSNYSNNLSTLDISSNCIISNLNCKNLPSLSCIEVCDTTTANFWDPQLRDPQHYFSLDCNYNVVNDISFINDELTSLKDIYGREVNKNYKGIVFYIYKSGNVEKRVKLDK
ncbi:MAG: hypothetical protein CMD16_01645 [Flavobacteriales bacterium]|nr:hypothetical protein [Flavobacteriales bacterium]|tara:strand:- start:145 stop:1188 length:1044 start_codon:yes stop_codon:yes gene_type:complete